MTELYSYTTLARPVRHETDKVKGSRFIADLAPVVDAAGAEAVIAAVRAEFPDANHHCYAWRLDPAGKQTRAYDDGEPGASAGQPILRQLEGKGVTGIVAVVTRYFGGTKLGVGGLMRAYGGAAGEAVDRAELVEVRVQKRALLEYPYEVSGPVEGVLAAFEATAEEPTYGADVRCTVRLELERFGAFADELGERTAGRARLTEVAR